MNRYTHIAAFVLGVLAALGLYELFLKPDVTDTTVTEYREEVIYNVIDTTIVTYKDSLRVLQVDAKPSKEPTKYDSIRSYAGAIKLDYGSIKWKAETLGTLSKFEISPTLIIPERTVTTTTTKERVYKNKAIFVGGGIDSEINFSAGAYYINDKLLTGYEYYPITRTHEIKAAFRLFGK